MNIHTKYDKSGWLTYDALRFGNQHRQRQKNGEYDVRMRIKTVGQIAVELVEPVTDVVKTQTLHFSIAPARKKYKEFIGGEPVKVESPDHGQDIVL